MALRLGQLPSEHEPIAELIGRRAAAFHRKAARVRAEEWRPINFPETEPFGVLWFGDPHLDDDSCNWDLLLKHAAICRDVPGIYGASIGDATNNWVGRLIKKYADQGTTIGDARRLIRWFMRDSGVNWALWLVGNHDGWEHGEAILSLISDDSVYIPGWEAKVNLRAAGDSWKVHAAHDFKGSSIWNKAHGALRTSLLVSDAELYVSGHRHDWVTQSFERSGKGTVAHLAMVRGYKWFDSWAIENGFQASRGSASMLTVFVPGASPESRILTFADPVMGARVLTALRAPTRPVCRKPSKIPTRSSTSAARPTVVSATSAAPRRKSRPRSVAGRTGATSIRSSAKPSKRSPTRRRAS